MAVRSRNAIIRELLCAAPSTASEIVALTGLPAQRVSESLDQLTRLGHIRNGGRFVRRPQDVLYEITEKGLACDLPTIEARMKVTEWPHDIRHQRRQLAGSDTPTAGNASPASEREP